MIIRRRSQGQDIYFSQSCCFLFHFQVDFLLYIKHFQDVRRVIDVHKESAMVLMDTFTSIALKACGDVRHYNDRRLWIWAWWWRIYQRQRVQSERTHSRSFQKTEEPVQMKFQQFDYEKERKKRDFFSFFNFIKNWEEMISNDIYFQLIIILSFMLEQFWPSPDWNMDQGPTTYRLGSGQIRLGSQWAEPDPTQFAESHSFGARFSWTLSPYRGPL